MHNSTSANAAERPNKTAPTAMDKRNPNRLSTEPRSFPHTPNTRPTHLNITIRNMIANRIDIFYLLSNRLRIPAHPRRAFLSAVALLQAEYKSSISSTYYIPIMKICKYQSTSDRQIPDLIRPVSPVNTVRDRDDRASFRRIL